MTDESAATGADPLRDRVEALLRGAGLSDEPEIYDSSIHSWRCEHPDRYGHCSCLAELVDEVTSLARTAQGEAGVRGTAG